jgi:hypothetical protein
MLLEQLDSYKLDIIAILKIEVEGQRTWWRKGSYFIVQLPEEE